MPNLFGKTKENPFAYLYPFELRWAARTNNKRKIAITFTFSLLGLFINLIPLPIGESFETFLGSLFSTVPALAFGPLPGIVAGITAAIPLIIQKQHHLHFAVQTLQALLTASLVKNFTAREYLLEASLVFWLGIGVWLLQRMSFIAPELGGAKRVTVIYCSVLGTINGTSLAFGFLSTLPTRVWLELIPLSSYLNRISAGILNTIIMVITSLIADHIADIASLFNSQVTEMLTYELLFSWLAGTLLLVLASLLITRLIMLPVTRSLQRLIMLSAVSGETFDTLTDLRKFRPRIYEFDILRRHFHRVLASLKRTIESLKKAQTQIAVQNEHLIQQTINMEYAAKRDFLTGLLNLRSFESHMSMIWPLVRSGNLDIGILIVDADHFKAFNDTYGHLAGNTVLADLAPILLSQVRHDDIVARFGGEEFVIVVHYVDPEKCKQLAERIRQAVETSDLGITVSIGCAISSPEDINWRQILDRADTALYRAKEKGRNRVEYEPRQ